MIRVVVRLATVACLVTIVCLLVACSGENTTTSASLPAAATSAPTTTTTLATTTTEATTTTTRATSVDSTTTTATQTVGIDRAFASKVKTLADVTPKIEKGQWILDPVGAVPSDLAKLFQSATNERLLWVGPENRGDEMNAVLTTKYYALSFFGESGFGMNYFGGEPDRSPCHMAIGVFKDVIFIPGSADFYLRATNPLTGIDFYSRVALSVWTGKFPVETLINVFNFQLKYQYGMRSGIDTEHQLYLNDFVCKHKLSAYLKPGDVVAIASFVYAIADGPETALVDEKGVQIAGNMYVFRFNGADSIYAMFK